MAYRAIIILSAGSHCNKQSPITALSKEKAMLC